MKIIQLNFEISDDMELKAITISHNDTALKPDSNLLKMLAGVLIQAIDLNQEDCAIQDTLNDLNIGRAKR